MSGLDDIYDDFDSQPVAKPKAVVATLEFTCAKCRGTGRFVGYTGRDFGACNLCRGTGKLDKLITQDDLRRRKQAFQKGKQTKEDNKRARLVEFQTEHAAEYQWLWKNAERSEFARSLLDGLNQWGNLTEKQIAAVTNCVAKDAARRAEWAVKDATQKADKGGDVDVSKVTELLLHAKGNRATPRFIAGTLIISLAKATSANPGAVYVKSRGGEYFGKIAGGRYYPTREAPADTLAKLLEITRDPKGVAIAHGIATKECACCGAELTDPVSIAKGIGPICESKWF